MCGFIQRITDSYIVIDYNTDEELQDQLSKIESSVNKVLDCTFKEMKQISKTFVGSTKTDSPSNVHTFECKLPNYTIEESNGKFQVNANHCSDKVKPNFDIYIFLEHKDKDLLYHNAGVNLPLEKIKKLINKDLSIRVNKEHINDLEVYLNISHIANQTI